MALQHRRRLQPPRRDPRGAPVQGALEGQDPGLDGRLRLEQGQVGLQLRPGQGHRDGLQGHLRGLHDGRPQEPGAEAPPTRGAPGHGRQAPPAAPRGAGLPHPQDLVGREPRQRRGQGPAGVRRERPHGHDGHQRRRRPGRGLGGRGQALLGPDKQRRRGLPAQLEAPGEDPVRPDIHGLPARDSRHATGGEHPRHTRPRHPLRRDDLHPEGRPALREHPLRLRAGGHPGGRGEAPARPPEAR